MNNLGIIVISTDERKDIASIFDYYFKKHWNNFNGSLYYLSDNIDFDLSYPTLQTKGEQSLNKRLLYALKHMNEEHVIILCDDYFLKKKINNKKIQKCLEFISNIDCSFCEISNTFPRNRPLHLFKNIEIEKKDISLQPAIWKAGFLSQILPQFNGNPWQFEINLWYNDELDYSKAKLFIYKSNIFPFYNACFCGKRFFRKPYRKVSRDIHRHNLAFNLNLYKKASLKTCFHFWLVQFLLRTNFMNYRKRKSIEQRNNFLNKLI